MENEKIIENIFTLANNKGIRKGELEEKIGLSKGYLSRLKGKNELPSTEKMQRISEILGVSLERLLNEDYSDLGENDILTYDFICKVFDCSKDNNVVWKECTEEGEALAKCEDCFRKIEALIAPTDWEMECGVDSALREKEAYFAILPGTQQKLLFVRYEYVCFYPDGDPDITDMKELYMFNAEELSPVYLKRMHVDRIESLLNELYQLLHGRKGLNLEYTVKATMKAFLDFKIEE